MCVFVSMGNALKSFISKVGRVAIFYETFCIDFLLKKYCGTSLYSGKQMAEAKNPSLCIRRYKRNPKDQKLEFKIFLCHWEKMESETTVVSLYRYSKDKEWVNLSNGSNGLSYWQWREVEAQCPSWSERLQQTYEEGRFWSSAPWPFDPLWDQKWFLTCCLDTCLN